MEVTFSNIMFPYYIFSNVDFQPSISLSRETLFESSWVSIPANIFYEDGELIVGGEPRDLKICL